MTRRLADILGSGKQSGNTFTQGRPQDCTVWYNNETGEIYHVGPGSPTVNNSRLDPRKVSSVQLAYDIRGARPELARDGTPTDVEGKVLGKIARFRKREYGESLPS